MFIIENPLKMDDLGIPHFRKPPYKCIYIYIYTHTPKSLLVDSPGPHFNPHFTSPNAQISPSSFLVEVPLPGSTADPVVAYLKDDWCLSCNSEVEDFGEMLEMVEEVQDVVTDSAG